MNEYRFVPAYSCDIFYHLISGIRIKIATLLISIAYACNQHHDRENNSQHFLPVIQRHERSKKQYASAGQNIQISLDEDRHKQDRKQIEPDDRSRHDQSKIQELI